MDARQEILAYSVDRAARAAGIGRTKPCEAIARGELPSVKIGRRRLILAEDLRRWLAGKRAA
ncbi:MAG TPA: excisionase family DNA-binding protein [Geminicoccaceae bacterium]|nr:excisionase family DNA-binding protein [Geminicoccaceae bacterium]